jgi:TonB family protein
MPLITPSVASVLSTIHKSGILEIVIDEEGNVERAVMLDRVNPIFDALVLDVTRTWKYRPAMRGGVAVRYIKTISIVTQ